MNLIAHSHDIFCDCYNPMSHTISLIFEQEPDIKFSTPELDLIKKCLSGETTATATTTTDQELDVIGEGDLDALFKEDFEDEKDTG